MPQELSKALKSKIKWFMFMGKVLEKLHLAQLRNTNISEQQHWRQLWKWDNKLNECWKKNNLFFKKKKNNIQWHIKETQVSYWLVGNTVFVSLSQKNSEQLVQWTWTAHWHSISLFVRVQRLLPRSANDHGQNFIYFNLVVTSVPPNISLVESLKFSWKTCHLLDIVVFCVSPLTCLSAPEG